MQITGMPLKKFDRQCFENNKYSIRYYCDNDPRIVDGYLRWTLRPDPPQSPAGYLPQSHRPEWDANRPENQQYREWEDLSNGVS